MSSFSFVVFFFQAEDGIRDHCVTGVQTCALPICDDATERRLSVATVNRSLALFRIVLRLGRKLGALATVPDMELEKEPQRSEERRVGKECRSRRSPDH